MIRRSAGVIVMVWLLIAAGCDSVGPGTGVYTSTITALVKGELWNISYRGAPSQELSASAVTCNQDTLIITVYREYYRSKSYPVYRFGDIISIVITDFTSPDTYSLRSKTGVAYAYYYNPGAPIFGGPQYCVTNDVDTGRVIITSFKAMYSPVTGPIVTGTFYFRAKQPDGEEVVEVLNGAFNCRCSSGRNL